jgi:hypothetical protein
MKPVRDIGLNLGFLAAQGAVLIVAGALRVGAALTSRLGRLLRTGRGFVNRDRDE